MGDRDRKDRTNENRLRRRVSADGRSRGSRSRRGFGLRECATRPGAVLPDHHLSLDQGWVLKMPLDGAHVRSPYDGFSIFGREIGG